jgi:ABC-type lipopolysaccharide export system ATPase subunit
LISLVVSLSIYFTTNNIIIASSMALRSQLLSLELPNETGKTVPFYTYDGYLEEHDRHHIRAEARNFEQLKVTGGAVFGLLAFAVPRLSNRPPGDSPFLFFH